MNLIDGFFMTLDGFQFKFRPKKHAIVELTPTMRAQAEKAGKGRRDSKPEQSWKTHRVHGDEYTADIIGAEGEIAVCEFLGLEFNAAVHTHGDAGYDCVGNNGKTIDAKTFGFPKKLPLPLSATKFADIYVLAGMGMNRKSVALMGFATLHELRMGTIEVFQSRRATGMNHTLPFSKLHSIHDLKGLLNA